MQRKCVLTISFVLLLAALASLPTQAQNYNLLYSFTGRGDGSSPTYGTLVRDSKGNLYGTTEFGGNSGCGVVFQVTPGGEEIVLYSFICMSDGGNPVAGLVLSGNTLYGTTTVGGIGYGVVFAVNIKNGTETVLHAFKGGSDGIRPIAGLVQDKTGNLYGATIEGGSSNDGVIFKLVPQTRKETILHTFSGSDGETPYATLILDSSGEVLYGTTVYGGSSGSPGFGVAFSLTIATKHYSVLHNFTGSTDGAYPIGSLSIGPGGILYGTTINGGSSGNGGYGQGVVFEVAPKTGTESVLYTFTGFPDGEFPVAGVIPGKSGHLFGTTQGGGVRSQWGTIYEVDPKKRTDNILFRFQETDGAYPLDGLLQDSKGNFYGAADGGEFGGGVVFSIHP
jgi:uncharacterized repeat protein (TIGR03803 family)